MSGKIPGLNCQIRDPQQINDGTLCRQESFLPGFLSKYSDQASMMSPQEQILFPESGLENDEVTEFIAFAFADAALAIAKGLEKMGIKELLNLLMKKKEKDLTKAIEYFDPITKTYPNSPYVDKITHPNEILNQLNKSLADNLKDALGSDTVAKENLEIENIHQRYIKTGKWDFEGLDDWSFPDEDLQTLHQNYLRDHPVK